MSVDGVPHLISAAASGHLLALARAFDLVWCSGWEEKADEHLAPALCLPVRPPFLTFGQPQAHVHWKLGAVERHAGAGARDAGGRRAPRRGASAARDGRPFRPPLPRGAPPPPGADAARRDR